MFVVFGWNKPTHTNYGPTLPKNCGLCNGVVYHELVCHKTWFTLFFIPVIPYDTLWALRCPQCEALIELPSHMVTEARELNAATSRFEDQQISKEEYDAKVSSLERAFNLARELKEQDERSCPSCGSKYRLSDYRADTPEILCAACNTKLPTDAIEIERC